MYHAGEDKVAKEQSQVFAYNPVGEPDNHKQNPDAFLLSNTKIMTGQGKAIVCQVGENTVLAKKRKPGDLVIKEQNTWVEKKLGVISNQIKKYAIAVALLSISSSALYYLLAVLFT